MVHTPLRQLYYSSLRYSHIVETFAPGQAKVVIFLTHLSQSRGEVDTAPSDAVQRTRND